MLIFALGLKLHPPLGGGVGELFATNLFIHIYFSLFNWRLNFENQLPRLPGRALTVTTVRYSRFYPFVMFLNPEPYCLILCESCGPVGGIGAPRNRDIERTHFSYKPSLILKILCSLQISNLFLKCQEWLRNGRSTLMLQNWSIGISQNENMASWEEYMVNSVQRWRVHLLCEYLSKWRWKED